MLKIATLVLAIMLIYAGAYSLMSITKPEAILESTVKGATGKTLNDVQSDGYLEVLSVLCKNAGLLGLATVGFGFFVLFSGFRRARRWAWFAFIIAGGIGWLGGLILAISINDILNILIRAIGVILSMVGLLVPVKAFFGKGPEEREKLADFQERQDTIGEEK